MNIPREQFITIVEQSLDELPEETKDRMHNVAILVEDNPTQEQLDKTDKKNGFTLLGLFEGFGQSSHKNFGPVLPDRITLFRKPIIAYCNTEEEVKREVIKTLKHEIAHHFGSDEEGARKASKK